MNELYRRVKAFFDAGKDTATVPEFQPVTSLDDIGDGDDLLLSAGNNFRILAGIRVARDDGIVRICKGAQQFGIYIPGKEDNGYQPWEHPITHFSITTQDVTSGYLYRILPRKIKKTDGLESDEEKETVTSSFV